jgi:hypothetical protein
VGTDGDDCDCDESKLWELREWEPCEMMRREKGKEKFARRSESE